MGHLTSLCTYNKSSLSFVSDLYAKKRVRELGFYKLFNRFAELPVLSQLNGISCFSCLSRPVKEKYETTWFRKKVEFQS